MTTDIQIKKINHATIKINCSMDIALELSEAFKFEVPGHKFVASFKMGQWDGFIRLFNIGSRTIGSGLYQKVIDFANSHDYTYEVVDDHQTTGYESPDYKTPGIDFDSVAAYMESLNLHARGKPLAVRDYQVNGVLVALRDRQAIVVSSVGSGKSLMLYCTCRYITEVLGMRVLMIVPTIGLTTQMQGDFKDYSSHNGYVVEDNLHLITAGVTKDTDKPIVISTFQSLKECTEKWFNSYGAILTDEGHKIQSKSFQDIYGKATKVPYRLAYTGTIHDMKCHVLTMIGLTGPVHEIAVAKVLIAAGMLVPLKIKAISLDYPIEVCKEFKKMEYEDEIKWIISHPARNKFIKNIAVNCKGTTLVFFRYIEQGKTLFDLISDSVGDARKVFIINGDVDKDDREIIRLAANESDAIVIASYGTCAAGINLPAVENMVVAHPIKSKITFLQAIGRGLRLKEGKKFATLYDIGDNLTYKSKVNYTYGHFGERLLMLTREGYDFTITNVKF